ncbi:fimbria/pilus periplasmic chaperone [Enterobacter oligotrophicus]|nr:fimbria/pilus periplasmic chaperone [Enterobacter oligotrophicus]
MRNCRLWSVFSKYIVRGKWCPGLLFFLALPVVAVVNVEGTRVVFNAGERVASLNLINSGSTPALVQLWFDKGDIFTPPENSQTPVIALPPVFRLQPGELKDVKLQLISYDKLPGDRESLYWLNIYQVPPNTVSPGSDKRVILPLRLRMKVFIRPPALPSPLQADGKRLLFHLKNSSEKVVMMSNPTPWYMTLSALKARDQTVDGIILSPGENRELTLNEAIKPGKIQYDIINDNGNKWSYSSTLKYRNDVSLLSPLQGTP